MNVSKKIIIATLAASAVGLAAAPSFAQAPDGADGEGRVVHQRGPGPGGAGEHGGPRMRIHREQFGGPHGPRMQAGHGPGMGFEVFVERYDENGDGEISAAEIESVNTARVETFDTDGDGSMSLGEFKALWTDAMQRAIVRSFQERDTDGDALITLEEYSAESERVLSRLDRNDDGSIEQDELRGRRGPDGEAGPGAAPGREAPEGGPAEEN